MTPDEFKPAPTLVEVAAGYVRRFGYVSWKAIQNGFSGISTSAQVRYHFYPPTRYDVPAYEYVTTTDVDREYAAKVLEWARTQQDTGDFMNNIRVLAASPVVSHKNIGMLLAIFPAYKRHVEGEVERVRRAAAPVSQFVGTEGVRQQFDGLTVRNVQTFNTAYGWSTLYLFDDAQGNVLKWFSSGSSQDLEKGDTVSVKATVKAHETYRDVKQTSLSRVKVTTRAQQTLLAV